MPSTRLALHGFWFTRASHPNMFGKLKRYLHNVLVGADQEGNIILGGKPDETISAHSARAAAKGNPLGRFMVWWLDKLQANHGTLAERGDLARAEDVERTEQDALEHNLADAYKNGSDTPRNSQ